MAQLPNISEQVRATPQPTRGGTVGYQPSAVGEAVSGIGQVVGKIGSDYEEKQNRLDMTYADASLLKSQASVMDKLKDEQDYTKIRPTYEAEMTKYQQEAAALIKSPEAKRTFLAQSSLHLAGTLNSVNTLADTKQKEYGQASSLQHFDSLIDTASSTSDPKMSGSLLTVANGVVDASVASGFYTPVQGYEMKKKGAEKYGENWLAKMPYDQQLKLLTPSVRPEPQDYSQLDTKLPPDKEADFQKWKAQYAPNDSGADYDLRGAYLKGYKPSAENGHFPDVFKKPNHPTFSDQSKFAKDYPDKAGSWQGETYIPPKGKGFEGAISTVLKNEGGYVPIDGSSGAPAIYGINEKWHPVEYAQAKKISDTEGDAAGKKYAEGFYKTEYWDKKGIGNLPPATQTIVMDGVVNHSKDFGDKLIEAAKSGEPPEALIQMRRTEYKRLADANPDKYAQSLGGWNSRLDAIASGDSAVAAKSGTPVDFIPFEKRIELAKRAEGAVKADIELRDKDPMTYAQVHGITPNQPLDFSSPQALQGQLQNRAQASVELHNKYGAPLKVMTDNEAKAFTAKLDEMPINNQLGYLKTLRDSSDPQIYQAALQQIRPDSPVTAMAGMYLGIDRQMTTDTHWFKSNDAVSPEYVAQNLLEGEALLNPTKATKKENGIGKMFPMPPDGTPNQPGLRAAFNDYVGDSFRGQPQAADQAYQAYRSFYAAEAAKKGDYSGALDSDIAQKSVKSVIGAVIESGKNKVVAPWGMDETSFNDEAKIRYDDLKKLYSLPSDYSDVSLESTGETGTYRAQVGNGYLVDDKHKPIVIRLGK